MIYILLAVISLLLFALAVRIGSYFINFVSAIVMAVAIIPAIDWVIASLKALS